MVLNLTRYPNSLILMSQYITGEQNLPANFQQDNTFEKLPSSYFQVTIKFKRNFLKKKLIIIFFKFKKLFKTIFQKTKLLSSSLQTVVVKLVYSATRFVYQLAPRNFSHLAAKLFFTFSKLRLFLFPSPARPVWSLAPVIAIVWLFNTSV